MRFRWSPPSSATEILPLPEDPGAGWLREGRGAPEDRFLVLDAEVARLWGDQLEGAGAAGGRGSMVLEATERLKTPDTLVRLWQALAGARATRSTTLVVVGGGIVCDVAAMAASTWMRGMPLTLVPSTLLAMADAALGGKTAVNLLGVKNRVGTFHPAGTLLLVPALLRTLPPRELRSGMAEVLKTALIGAPGIRGSLPLDTSGAGWEAEAARISMECLAVKGGIVSRDLTDTGERMLLNLGHTAGHALESRSGFRLSHGEAVGLGMLVEAEMASGLGGEPGLGCELRALLSSCGLPVGLPGGVDMAGIMALVAGDKKSGTGSRTWALPFGWGDCRLVQLEPEEEERLVSGALEAVLPG